MYSKKINQLATNLNPQETDLIPIGDAETGQLKTTTFNQISGITGDGVISGGIVTWTGTGLNFNISACTYILNGIRYTSPASTKTLAAADPTNDRIDVFAVNTSSQVVVIQGTPATNPIEPEGDTATTLGLTNVTIAAGATTPSGVNRDLIYDENVESWTKTITQSASTYNLADTAFAYTGTKSILATMGAGFIFFSFSKAVAMDISNYKSLSFAIRLNAAWTSNQILSVRFFNGQNFVTNNFQIGNNNNVGFNRNLAGQWQLITIPLNNTNLKFTNNAFTLIRIGTQNAACTYRLDTIQLNGGINNPIGGGTTPSNSFGFVNGSTGSAIATQATDTLNVVGTGLATTSATGKTLTIAVPSPIPSQTGNTGKFLTTDGSVVSWGTPTDTGITSLNSQTGTTQTFATGTNGTDFAISSAANTHTFNLPTASATNRGALSSADWSTFNGKQGALTLTTTGTSGAATLVGNTLNIPQYGGGGMAIGGSITSATTGSVLFVGASSALAQNNANFFWDDTNNRLGIGTNTPTNAVHIAANINSGFSGLNVSNSSAGNAASSSLFVSNDIGAGFTIQALGSGYTPSGVLQPNSARFRASAALVNGFYFGTGFNATPAPIILFTNDIERARITGAGRLLIGTTTESTFLLDVNGTARVSGLDVNGITKLNGNTTFGTLGTGTGMFWDNTNNRLGIGTNAPAAQIHATSSANSGNSIRIENTSTGNAAFATLSVNSNAGSFTAQAFGSGVTIDVPNYIYPSSAKFRSSSGLTNGMFFMVGANAPMVWGTQDTERFRITGAGRLLLGTTTESTFLLDVNGQTRSTQYNLSALNTAPATATSTGTLGEIRIDANHIYICTATNTWKRVAIATF